MNFSCEQMILQEAISTCSYCVSPKSAMPALEGLLFQAEGQQVKITGYDLKKAIVATIPAQVEEPGSIVLEARFMNALVRSFSGGEVTISTQVGYDTLIINGDASFHTVGTSSDDYPELPVIDQKNAIRLPQKLLGKMIRQTVFCVSDNESRPVYTGELFEVQGDTLTIVAVDGFRLALRREKVNAGDVEDCTFIVPGNALNNLEKLCGDTDERVEILIGQNHIAFQVGSKTLISRRLEGEFLDYNRTLPTQFTMTFKADRNALEEAVSRIAIVLDNDKSKTPLRLSIRENCINISCNTGIRRGKEVVSVEGDPEWELDIGFNSTYLLGALRAIPDSGVRLCMSSPSSPCVITPDKDDDSCRYMILPVRLKAP